MIDTTRRPPATRTLVGELFGFDPFRPMVAPELLGFDIQRTDQGYRLEIPVAGFRPEDINITVEDRQLTVEGRSDRRRFTRSIVVPEEIDVDRIEAQVQNGLLTLVLPLHERVQPRRIQIRAQDGSSTSNGDNSGSESRMGDSSGSQIPTVSGETRSSGGTTGSSSDAAASSGAAQTAKT